MSLSPESRLGVYQIVSLIGRGGMGEVYRARDTRLARDVAIKLLPDAKASDPAWRARFEREARALAAMSHPNIAVIHGIEENRLPDRGDASLALVMELVDGETLADRLRRGRLSVPEALNVAGQIADALDAAHQKGIVHRDLKPANVKITSTGAVKVLDFGLAKTLADAGAESSTVTLTAADIAIGTPAYMAPEQARGKSDDTRVDVWAFGVVLYEMVTGNRPFRGESVQDTLTSILTADPDWTAVPANLQPLLRACLQREPEKRLRDIADYRFLLEGSRSHPPRASRMPIRAALAAVGLIATATIAYLVGTSFARSPGDSTGGSPVRLSTMLPAGVSVTRGPGYTSSVAVSPDGRTIVIAASDKDGQRLYRRPLDRLEPAPLAGSERASSPFFSWDGKWIGFFADGRLKRIPADGGASVDMTEAPGYSSGASWGPDDQIVFAYNADSQLHIVPAQGGSSQLLNAEIRGRQPEVLPDGRTVLFEHAGHVHAYDRQTRAIKKLLPGTAPRFANGHVIFSRARTLLAARFDPVDGSIGAAVPLADGVAVELPGSGGGRHYAVARSGTLVYVPAPDAYEMVVVDRKGLERLVGERQRSLENPRFSPDGNHVVVAATRRDDEPAELWLHDLVNGTATRLTYSGGRAAIWSADGKTITYSHLGKEQGIYTTRADGGGEQKRILELKNFHWLVGASPDGSNLLYGQMLAGSQSEILSYSNTRSRTVVDAKSTWGGRLSRDGKWLAYYILESGRFEVHVTRFPAGGAHWLIAEGTDPAWGGDGTLYYRNGPRLMAARLDQSAGVKVVSSRVVVDPFLPPLYDDYDIHPDGHTLVLIRPANRTQGREVTMVLGWFNEFQRTER
ncbi:MAG TPA: protein kinase [Vicinamibacterales bacterium]|nr:protein kinase [Vicinamibacterales bacterium]